VNVRIGAEFAGLTECDADGESVVYRCNGGSFPCMFYNERASIRGGSSLPLDT